MNKPLYNWLDKIEGKKEGETIKNIEKEKAIRMSKFNKNFSEAFFKMASKIK